LHKYFKQYSQDGRNVFNKSGDFILAAASAISFSASLPVIRPDQVPSSALWKSAYSSAALQILLHKVELIFVVTLEKWNEL